MKGRRDWLNLAIPSNMYVFLPLMQQHHHSGSGAQCNVKGEGAGAGGAGQHYPHAQLAGKSMQLISHNASALLCTPSPMQELLAIKGISEAKVEKILEACKKLQPCSFVTGSEALLAHKKVRTTSVEGFCTLCGGEGHWGAF